MSETCWDEAVGIAREEHGDTTPTLRCTLSEAEMEETFSDGFGGHEGKAFTLWTEKRVYFPLVYDGSEWVGSAPRDPCDEAMEHQGGE